MPREYPRHFVIRPSGFYFQATPAMKRGGIFSEALGREITSAVGRAQALNASWDQIRRGLARISQTKRCIGAENLG